MKLTSRARPPFPIEPPLPDCRCVLPKSPDLDLSTMPELAEWLIAERRREMFEEIMGKSPRMVLVGKLLGHDTGTGVFRVKPQVRPMYPFK